MKLSFNWLSELVKLPKGVRPREVAERLSLSGLEVESIEARGHEISGVRVAEVVGVRPHPGSEKLRIVGLTLGDGAEHEVVCGASNVPGPGGRVAWAPPGATLPGGITMGRKEIRGFESPGMICSETELGFGEESDGILILTDDAAAGWVAGADLAEVLRLADHVFEVNVTPNRSDALSHAGIARELAALYETTWSLPDPIFAPPPFTGIESPFPVELRDVDADTDPDPDTDTDTDTDAAAAAANSGRRELGRGSAVACSRYHATVVRGVHVAPSPLAIRLRLRTCGVRPVSNLVDVTNYVMLETGHPLHVFDLARLAPPIVVRRARPGETLRTLDGHLRTLEPGEDIVIADKHGVIALAGVMGGASTEVVPTTTDVLLEAATFDPRSVRRTAKRLGLRSEASHRFERGVDAQTVAQAGTRAARLLAEVGGGTVAPTVTDVYPTPAKSRTLSLSLRKLNKIAGFEISAAQAIATLGGLGIVSSVADEGIAATIPSFRPDVTIEEDLIEEVMRMIGLDKVPTRLPAAGKAPNRHPERVVERACDALSALGLREIVTWAFVPKAALAALGRADLASGITVKNPISSDYEVMRTSLLPGLAETAKRNLARGAEGVALFEVGPVIRPLPDDPDRHHEQRTMAAGIVVGRQPGWLKPGDPIDFYDVKHVVVELLRHLGVPLDQVQFTSLAAQGSDDEEKGYLHPGISARIHFGASVSAKVEARPDIEPGGSWDGPTTVNGELDEAAQDGVGVGATGFADGNLGAVGQLHPVASRRFGLESTAFFFEIEVDRLQTNAHSQVHAVPVPRFPAASRDVSFWIDLAVPAAEQEAAMRGVPEPLLTGIAVLEDFRDSRFAPAGKKGMLWTLTYQAGDRTLTDPEVDLAHSRIVGELARRHTIQIR